MCRSYLTRSVPRATLDRVLDAARKVPSAGHSQGVRFAVTTSRQIRNKIAQAYQEDKYLEKGFEPWLSVAPVHIVVAVNEESYVKRYSESDKSTEPESWPVPYSIMDGGKALMALYLACEEFGLSCGYLGPHAGPDLVELLKLPSDWRFLGLVTVGYRKGRPQKTRSQRRGWKPHHEVVTWLQ